MNEWARPVRTGWNTFTCFKIATNDKYRRRPIQIVRKYRPNAFISNCIRLRWQTATPTTIDTWMNWTFLVYRTTINIRFVSVFLFTNSMPQNLFNVLCVCLPVCMHEYVNCELYNKYICLFQRQGHRIKIMFTARQHPIDCVAFIQTLINIYTKLPFWNGSLKVNKSKSSEWERDGGGGATWCDVMI